MKKLFPLAILLLCFFCINITNAQSNKSIITTEDVGPLKCFYLKQETANQISEYHIQVVYKNQQFVYKQEQDTIHLKSKE